VTAIAATIRAVLVRSTERCLSAKGQVLEAAGPTGLGLVWREGASQTTIRSTAIAKNTLWALCTAIPIQALR
jgi:hypothetical protein